MLSKRSVFEQGMCSCFKSVRPKKYTSLSRRGLKKELPIREAPNDYDVMKGVRFLRK